MTRQEYTGRVLSALHRLTKEERNAVQAELDAHIEDHICALMDLGYEEALAEERAMEQMGNPEEVGQELDKQYPMRWLILQRITAIIIAVMVINAVLGIGILFHAYDHLEARFFPQALTNDNFSVESTEENDLRVSVGNDILRIYRVSVGKREMWRTDLQDRQTMQVAEVAACAYDQIPFGIVSGELLCNLKLTDQRGENMTRQESNGGKSSWGADYRNFYVPIESGDTAVTLTYDRMGEYVTVEIPLPEVTA